MNATKNMTAMIAELETATRGNEELTALYAKLKSVALEFTVLEHLLAEAEEKANALYTQIQDKIAEEKKMAEEKAKKNEDQVASETAKSKRAAKKNKKAKKGSKKNTKESQPAEPAIAEPAIAEPETIDPKTEQRRAARAIGRENKAKYARWEKEAKKKLPVFDRPNHVVAYAYYDENGVLLGKKPLPKK